MPPPPATPSVKEARNTPITTIRTIFGVRAIGMSIARIFLSSFPLLVKRHCNTLRPKGEEAVPLPKRKVFFYDISTNTRLMKAFVYGMID